MKTTLLALAAALLLLPACGDTSTDGAPDREAMPDAVSGVTDQISDEVSDAVSMDDEPGAPVVTVDDYLGTYSVTETCSQMGTDVNGNPRSGTVSDAYSATIVRGSGDGRVTVENLFNSPGDAVSSPATVDANAITLVGDDVSQRDGMAITFSGTGTRDEGGTVSLTYTMDVQSTTGGPIDAQTTCEATLTPTG
ncbi:hypothetical protein [Rubrivirga sp. IMCC45206]|uniref:hypothetical protein n=1 Tax=Rubrivirga sp. IMCC45206 TaxID=3391614 RepID=UPI00399020EB